MKIIIVAAIIALASVSAAAQTNTDALAQSYRMLTIQVIDGMASLNVQVQQLQNENQKLKADLEAAKAAAPKEGAQK